VDRANQVNRIGAADLDRLDAHSQHAAGQPAARQKISGCPHSSFDADPGLEQCPHDLQ